MIKDLHHFPDILELIEEAVEFSDGHIQRPLPIRILTQLQKLFIDWAIEKRVRFEIKNKTLKVVIKGRKTNTYPLKSVL